MGNDLMGNDLMKSDLIFPMALYVFFMGGLATYMFLGRANAVRKGLVKMKFYRAQVGEAPPEAVVVVGRHYDNQFQVPILFFITCLAHMQAGQINNLTIGLAWFFVLSRFAHSLVMLGKNNVLHRAVAFALGWIAIVAMWVQLVVSLPV